MGLLLGLFAATQLGSWGRNFPGVSLELGQRQLLHLQPELRQLLQSSDAPIFATWYVSSPEKLPSDRHSMAEDVNDLLAVMRATAPGRFDFAQVDPEADSDLAAYASKRRVSPFRALNIRGDASATGPIYSTLTFEQSGRSPARIEHIGPEHLGDLQNIILEHLRGNGEQSPPRFLLARPEDGAEGFAQLQDALAARGEVRTIDFEAVEPGELDLWSEVLFWMDPGLGGADKIPELERYLESGRSVILAGGANSLGAKSLFRELGLDTKPGRILTDLAANTKRGERVELVPCIAPDQDFRRLSGQPNGTLFFEAPGALTFIPDTLDRRGVSARRIANSSERTILEIDGVQQGAPKLALGVLLEPVDARRGSLVALAAATPLVDGFLDMAGAAHRPLLASLIDSFAGQNRRALLRAGAAPPQRLARFSDDERLLVRSALWAPLPLFLLIIGVWRKKRGADLIFRGRGLANGKQLAATGCAAGFLGLAAWAASTHAGPRADLTAEGLNTPSQVTIDIAEEVSLRGPLQAQLYFSAPATLSPLLAQLPRRIHGLLDSLGRAGLASTRAEIRPSSLSDNEVAALEKSGIRSFRAARSMATNQASASATAAWATLELRRGEQREVLSFQDEHEAEELEFRVAFALERMRQEGLSPGSGEVRVGFASDLPRMSAAEDYEYQSKGSFAPREGDVFQLARAALSRAGFTVEHIDPRDPQIGKSAAFEYGALLWLQPRRNTLPMLDAFQSYLRRGGSAILAAQHFRTQARQYRGSDFELVFWPQPQVPDVDRFWFPEFGVDLVREVLFDKASVTIPIDTRILGKGAELEFQPEPTRAPFLVRASASNFADCEGILVGTGDLALADPNWIRLDEELLEDSGLQAKVLFTGSEESWHADWQGGWLTDEMLGGPSVAPDDFSYEVRPALGVLIEGTFPAPKNLGEDGVGQPIAFKALPTEELAPGRLLFVGNSSFLTDNAIAGDEFRGDAFLLAAVANLALRNSGPNGARLAKLAAKRPTERGFGLLTSPLRRNARLAVMGGGAGALALLLLTWRFVRRGSSARPTTRPSHTPAQAQPLRFAAVLGPAALALLAFGADALFASNLAENRTGTLRLGRLFAPETRAVEVTAMRLTQGPGTSLEQSWIWVHGTFGGGPGYDPRAPHPPEDAADLRGDPSGSWREISGAGALGDRSAITAAIESIWTAEGIVAHPGTSDSAAFGFGDPAAWRFELFDYPTESDPLKWKAPIASLDVGTTSQDGLSAYLRVGGAPSIWSADTNPAAGIPRGAVHKFPPLAESRLLPREWAGQQVGISALAWQVVGGSSLRLTSTPQVRTIEELQAGRAPVLWRLLGKGEDTLMDDAPGANARGGAVAAEALLEYLMNAKALELLDPARAAEYGLSPNDQPLAIVLLESNPLPLPEGSTEPEGPRVPLMLRIGPLLPPELGGGHAVVNTFSGNLIRMPAKFVELALPLASDFEDPERIRGWKIR